MHQGGRGLHRRRRLAPRIIVRRNEVFAARPAESIPALLSRELLCSDTRTPNPSFFILLSLYVGGPSRILRIRRALEPGSGDRRLVGAGDSRWLLSDNAQITTGF
jgi:hypothetical protein